MTTNNSSAQSQICGYDPGFGNTSVYTEGGLETIQTAAAIPNSVGLAGIGLKAGGSQSIEVTFAGQHIAVGPGAWQRGVPLTSMDYLSLVSPARLALFYAALSKVIPHADARTDKSPELTVVIGLPVPLLQDTAQAGLVIESLKGLKRDHDFVIGGRNFVFSLKKLKVVAQPLGAYVDWLYDDELQLRPNGSKAEVAVMDIGMNTLDLYVVQGGQVLERHIGGAEVGVRRLLDLIGASGHDLVELDADLRQGRLKPTSVHLDGWLSEILAATKHSWPSLKRFTAVIPAGGGAVVLGDRLNTALAAKGAALHWPKDPLTTNVRGFWKYGVKHAA